MIGIIDYGMGNLQSVKNSCEFMGEAVKIVTRVGELDDLTGIILPGVGSFALGMANLLSPERGFVTVGEQGELKGPLKIQAHVLKKPLLGICLGMQLLANFGEEGGPTNALGFIAGTVRRFELPPGYRIPHVGWNSIRVERQNPLIEPGMDVDYYFVHSYYFEPARKEDTIATCEYGAKTFACAVGRDNIFGVQFHPEKSHSYGLKVLGNFFKFCNAYAQKKAYSRSLS